MALAKKCDRCGNLYEHYPKNKMVQNNAIRRLYKNEYGNISSQDDTIDLCKKCMSEFENFMLFKEKNNAEN